MGRGLPIVLGLMVLAGAAAARQPILVLPLVQAQCEGAVPCQPAFEFRTGTAQLMLDAAMAGQGVALASDVLAERSLRERRLACPFRVRAESPATYHLVMRPEDRQRRDVCAFRDWIVGQMAAWRRQSPRPLLQRKRGGAETV